MKNKPRRGDINRCTSVRYRSPFALAGGRAAETHLVGDGKAELFRTSTGIARRKYDVLTQGSLRRGEDRSYGV